MYSAPAGPRCCEGPAYTPMEHPSWTQGACSAGFGRKTVAELTDVVVVVDVVAAVVDVAAVAAVSLRLLFLLLLLLLLLVVLRLQLLLVSD